MIAPASSAVDGPVFAAQATIREGVHSAWRLCDSGMCSGSVLEPGLRLRTCEATRLPCRKTSTVLRRHPHVEHLAGIDVRDAVVMAVELDVVVDVDFGRLEVGGLVALGRQRAQRRLVDLLEEGLA